MAAGGSASGEVCYSIQWQINNFINCREPKRLTSSITSLPGLPGLLNIWLDRVYWGNDIFLSVSLQYSPLPQSRVLNVTSLQLRVECQCTYGTDKLACAGEKTSESVWNCQMVLYQHSLCNFKRLLNDLSAGISYPRDFNFVLKLEGKLQEAPYPTFTLSNDLKKLYDGGQDPDVTLVGDDDVEVTAHKLILSARSPVFAAMFQHDMSEKQTGRVKIAGFHSDVLQGMVYYMYTDQEPEQLDSMAFRILQAADSYHLQGLKQICEFHLGCQLQVSNLYTTLQEATTFNCPNLVLRCMEYAAEHVKELKSPEFGKEAETVESSKD